MNRQKMMSLVRQAIEKYKMIKEGDRVAVGLSGGKDSMALLCLLAQISRFYPKKFQLSAIYVDLGYQKETSQEMERFCQEWKVPFYVVKTQIAEILEKRQEKHPCSLCAKMRKGALCQKALELKCNKIAYAHHMDDFTETMVMNLIFQGRFYAFPPVTKMEDCRLEIIRPLMFITEAEVKGFQKKENIPVLKNPCPVDGITKREEIKQLLREWNKKYPGISKKLFHAIEHGNIEDWGMTEEKTAEKATSMRTRNKD